MTGMLVWMLDSATKKWIYEITQCTIPFDYGALKRLFKTEFDFMTFKTESKDEKNDKKNTIDWFCFNLAIYASLLVNYFYRTFMRGIVTNLVFSMIRIFDIVGFEIHFMRFLAWAVLDTKAQKGP